MPNLSDDDKICFEECHQIVGCAFKVYNQLGHGFLEQVYQCALEIELKHAKIPFEAQKQIPVYYLGEKLDAYYKADILCFDKVIVELKADYSLSDVHEAQLINYLKATGIQAGLLINFGNRRKLEFKKIVYTNTRYANNELKE